MSSAGVETWTAKRVLVVEDDEILLRAVARQLTRGGYQVQTAGGVLAARDQLERELPDVIVSDMMLPDGSGLDVLDAASRCEPPIPVLVMTGTADAGTVATAFAAGVVRYLRKPLAAVELIDAVVEACRPREAAVRTTAPTSPPSLSEIDRRFAAAMASLSVTLQPIASWSRSKVFAYEARPVSGDLDRAGLLGLARAVGRVPELGRAMRAAVAVRFAEIPEDVGLHVGVDRDELADAELYTEASPLATFAPRVTLALTEAAARHDLEQTFHRLALLRSAGYRIAIDQLGPDGASLIALAATRPEVIGLSPALIHDLRHDGIRQVVLRSLHQLATQLGADVVARGLDTGDALASVLEAGGDLVQGDILGPAWPVAAAVDFARVRRQIGVRRHGRTTHRGPSRGKAASLAGPDRGAMARALQDDLSASLSSLSEVLATADEDPQGLADHRGELRRLVDQCQTLADAIATMTAARKP